MLAGMSRGVRRHHHSGGPPTTEPDAASFWQARYAESEQIWSGEPNHALVTTVAALQPGRALDLGCGEGGDSVWLAGRGWQVTAIDIATSAIVRARERAAARRIPDGRITWIIEDLARWQPTETYELVSACFLHSPIDFPRMAVLRRAAAAIVPGGHLLVVGHAESPPWSDAQDRAHHRLLDPPEEMAALQLDGTAWETVVSDVRPRQATGPDGEHATLRDTVVLLRRR